MVKVVHWKGTLQDCGGGGRWSVAELLRGPCGWVAYLQFGPGLCALNTFEFFFFMTLRIQNLPHQTRCQT